MTTAAAAEAVRVPLNRGGPALVDAADAALVSGGKWHLTRKGYAARRIAGRVVFMHRLILGAAVTEGRVTDHVNGDRLDNRRANLRVVTPGQSSANTGRHRDGRSGYKGVHWSKQKQKWLAVIMVSGAVKYLGAFDDPRAAAVCRDRAALRYQGQYARLNFPAEAPGPKEDRQ